MRRGAAAVLAAALLLTACKALQPPEEHDVKALERPKPAPQPAAECVPRVVEITSGADELLQYYAGLRTRSTAALKLELDDVKKEFAATGQEAARLKLAMLYQLPHSPLRNENQSAQLLEPYTRGDVRSLGPLRGVAQMLLAAIDQSRRQETALQAQIAKVKDEQKRADELQRKLDALKDVERAMIQKDQGAKPK